MSLSAMVPFLLALVKAVVVVVFALGLGGLLTWADRRQGAMHQDRVGPNRAVVWLPRWAAIAAAVVPALLIAGGMLYLAFGSRWGSTAVVSLRSAAIGHLALFMVWLTLIVIAGRIRIRGVRHSFDAFVASIGDPRRIFFAGVLAHALVLLLGLVFRGRPEALTLAKALHGGGAAVFAAVVLFGAGYAAHALSSSERVGVRALGTLHLLADGLKTLLKEDFVPPNADKLLHGLAPLIAFFPPLVLLAVVPFGDTLCFGTDAQGQIDLLHPLSRVPRDAVCAQGAVPLQVADLDVGLLYVFALTGTGIVGAAIAGWASDNKFSLLGGLRASSQMISYEVTLGLAVMGALMIYGTLRMDAMVSWQAEHAWGIFVQPLAVIPFLAASLAESKRIPFDIPEGESEVVAGYFTEYSGMKFAMFFFSEYVAIVAIGGLMATLFFGGWHVPFLERDGFLVTLGDHVIWQLPLGHVWVVLLGVAAFVLKVLILCWFQLVIRWTLPRFRFDQLMGLGWRVLLPLNLVNVLVTGLVLLTLASAGPALQRALGVAGDVTEFAVVGAALAAAIAVVILIVSPAEKRASPSTSAVRFARALGGTKTSPMGA